VRWNRLREDYASMMLRWTRPCHRVLLFVTFTRFSRHARWVHRLNLSISRSISHAQKPPIPRSNRVDSLYKTRYFVFAARIYCSIVMALSRHAVHVHTMVSLKSAPETPQRSAIACWNLLDEAFPTVQSAPRVCNVLQVFRPLDRWTHHAHIIH